MEKFGAYRCRKCAQINRQVMVIKYVPASRELNEIVEEHLHVTCQCGFEWDMPCDVEESENDG